RRRDRPFEPADTRKSQASPADVPSSDRLCPKIGEAEEVDQTIHKTRKEIAPVYSVTPQRIQQIEKEGLAQLSDALRRRGLALEDFDFGGPA
ncbi:hypothetical protein DLJ49_21335, partial [Rhodovulum sp. 12E13]|uniref:hypothetical protein n=1 Tax=Rhodovulum sp. 12E13 TaxID=2203891 RepID=UPI000E183FBF